MCVAQEGVELPNSLEHLTFQGFFNRNLEHVSLPRNLKHLSFGWLFNQSLEPCHILSPRVEAVVDWSF